MNGKQRVRTLVAIGVLLGAALSCVAVEGGPSSVEGQIQLTPAKPGDTIKDLSKVVVWLEAVDGKPSDPPADHFKMVQKDKTFEPDLLVVPVGSVVDFPNLDPWFHNVFSLFRGKRFDLGLYQAGSQKTVTFDRPGVSYLFCNIHPEMTAQVVVVESKWFATTDSSGRYKIVDVPPGKYQLHLFYRAAEPEALRRLQRTVEIGEHGRTLAPITIPVQKIDPKAHKNKYGHDYEPDPMKPEY
jgi:plastocyanin